MALTRSQAAQELIAHYGDLMLDVGKAATDTTGNLKEPIDRTFRAMGTLYAGLASATLDDTELDTFLTLGGYFVVERALDAASGMADVAATTLGTSKRKSQIVANLRARREELRERAIAAGYFAVVGAVMAGGVYGLDTIEPADDAA